MASDEYPEPRYASWGQRAGALLLDGLVIVAPFFLLAFVLLLVIGPDDNSATDDSAAYGALVGRRHDHRPVLLHAHARPPQRPDSGKARP